MEALFDDHKMLDALDRDQLVDWLRYLKEQQGIEVEFLDIDRTDQAGMIDVNRLQFKRG